MLAAADVTEEAQMRAVIKQTLTTFGALHGVIHAAALPPSGLIQLKTPEQAAQILAPKVQGTLILDRLLRGIPLDFLLLFSSMSSSTGGGPGQVGPDAVVRPGAAEAGPERAPVSRSSLLSST